LALAASQGFGDLDDGWPLLQGALVAAGFDAQVVIWDDPMVDWQSFDLVTVNYAWGYVTRRREFLDWAATVATETRLVNPEPLVRWNSEKTYLADLAADGIPIVPTWWVPPGAAWAPPSDDYVGRQRQPRRRPLCAGGNRNRRRPRSPVAPRRADGDGPALSTGH
jgi:hypothetical protein